MQLQKVNLVLLLLLMILVLFVIFTKPIENSSNSDFLETIIKENKENIRKDSILLKQKILTIEQKINEIKSNQTIIYKVYEKEQKQFDVLVCDSSFIAINDSIYEMLRSMRYE